MHSPNALRSYSCPQPAWAEECASQTSGRAQAPLAELISSSSSTEGDNVRRRGGSQIGSEAAAQYADQQWNFEGSRSSLDSVEVAADGAAVPSADSEASRRGQGATTWQQEEPAHQDALRCAVTVLIEGARLVWGSLLLQTGWLLCISHVAHNSILIQGRKEAAKPGPCGGQGLC